MNHTAEIGSTVVSDIRAPIVIAEAGQCMEGSVEKAAEMATRAAAAGAWGFKVQLLHPEWIAAPDARRYWEHGDDVDQREVFRRNGLVPYPAWAAVAEHCAEIGIEFLGTPFDTAAVATLGSISRVIKVASGDINNVRLLDAVRETGCAVILSTGASTFREIRWAVDRLAEHAGPVALLACSLEYPTPPARAALGRIETLRDLFPGLVVGYSDHTEDTWAAGPAVAHGARILEKHYSIGGARNVPDHEMAVDDLGLYDYVQGAEQAWAGGGIGYLNLHDGEKPAARGARRSWYATAHIPKGAVIQPDDVIPLRPHDVDGARVDVDLAGWKATKPILAGTVVRQDAVKHPSAGRSPSARQALDDGDVDSATRSLLGRFGR